MGTPKTPTPRIRGPKALGKEPEMLRCARCGEVCAKEGFVGEDSGPAQTCGCGVWVSWELWQKIHSQLIGKQAEVESRTEEQMQESSRFESELDVYKKQIANMEDAHKSRERELKAELLEKTRENVALKREVDESRLVRERETRASTARAQDLHMQVEDQAKERDDLMMARMRLQKELDEASLKLRLSDHRMQVAESRALSMEKELVHLKDRNTGNMLRIEALEKKVKETETAANDWRVHAEMYKSKLTQHVGPSKELATESERLKLDNRRLVGLLENTDEFRAVMTRSALTRGTHYVTLSECLVEEGWVSEIYAPEMDRPVDVNLEEYHWLPKNAIAITVAFLEEVFPRLPTGPFMHLLMHLSKVWRQHHKEDVAERKKKHDAEVAELRRALENHRPYYAVYAQDKIRHLKKAVHEQGKMTKAEQRRRHKDKETFGEDSRVMLKWGLNTMEHLSKQVAEMMHENKALRSSLVSPGAWDGSRTAPHSPVFVPSHTGDFQSYRALVSPRSRARSPGNTAYGSTSVPMRAQEAILDGIWASTPLGVMPSTPLDEGLPTEPVKPYFNDDQAERDRKISTAAARRSSLTDETKPGAQKVIKFKRADVN